MYTIKKNILRGRYEVYTDYSENQKKLNLIYTSKNRSNCESFIKRRIYGLAQYRAAIYSHKLDEVITVVYPRMTTESGAKLIFESLCESTPDFALGEISEVAYAENKA